MYVSTTVVWFLVGCIGDIILTLIGGWMLSCMWGWFMVPIFELPPLTVVHAVGLMVVLSFVGGHSGKKTPEDDMGEWPSEVLREGAWDMCQRAAKMTTLFGIGFVVSLFM